jgi:hypothetical protein
MVFGSFDCDKALLGELQPLNSVRFNLGGINLYNIQCFLKGQVEKEIHDFLLVNHSN